MRRRGETQQNLWVHMLGPLSVLIQSEALSQISESDFDSETLKRASDWIGMFKGSNVCAQRFSHISPLYLPLYLVLVHEYLPG